MFVSENLMRNRIFTESQNTSWKNKFNSYKEEKQLFYSGETWQLPPYQIFKIITTKGRLSSSVSWVSDLGSGHDLMVCGFELSVGLCADSSEPRACFGFCVFLSLPLPDLCSVSLKNE